MNETKPVRLKFQDRQALHMGCFTDPQVKMGKSAFLSQLALLAVVSCLSLQGTAGQGFSSSYAYQSFGFSMQHCRDIAFGTSAWVGQYPFVVFLELDHGEDQCGGTLLSKSWVLTAAHCFDDGRLLTKILLGTHTRDGRVPNVTETREMRQKFCHKDYNDFTMANDICLIKLSSPVTFGKYIQKANLPPANSKVAVGSSTVILGWGLNEDSIIPNDLQRGDFQVVNRKKCIDLYAQDGRLIPKNHFCAGGVATNTCIGDSGGPLVVEEKNGKFTLRGVTSFGPRNGKCGLPGIPGVYVRVSSYVSWINEKMSRPSIERSWTPWKSLGCSATCGEGIERLTRRCQDEDGKTVSGCFGPASKVRACTRLSCKVNPRYKWGKWRKHCSVTCGTGIENNFRQCLDDQGRAVTSSHCSPGSEYDRGSCILSPCVKPNDWGPWTKTCSVTCGTGTETKVRKCLDKHGLEVLSSLCSPGDAIEHGPCTMPTCGTNDWGPWSETCSVTCGTGTETKVRKCLDKHGLEVLPSLCSPGDTIKHGPCAMSPCGTHVWGPWKTTCSVTCGMGTETKIRKCLDQDGVQVLSSFCSPPYDTEVKSCERSPCIEYIWSPWKEVFCSVTCGQGSEVKTRQCRGSNGHRVSSKYCRGSWLQRGICTKSSCQGSSILEWGRWSSWSECRVKVHQQYSCDGFRAATRDCLQFGRNVYPQRCISTIGGDYYKEESCTPYSC